MRRVASGPRKPALRRTPEPENGISPQAEPSAPLFGPTMDDPSNRRPIGNPAGHIGESHETSAPTDAAPGRSLLAWDDRPGPWWAWPLATGWRQGPASGASRPAAPTSGQRWTAARRPPAWGRRRRRSAHNGQDAPHTTSAAKSSRAAATSRGRSRGEGLSAAARRSARAAERCVWVRVPGSPATQRVEET